MPILTISPGLEATGPISTIFAASSLPTSRATRLIIEGRIDSHIYDYIQYEAGRVAAVRVIDLDSLGGNAEWALMIARKVKELGKTTELRSQHYCASACVAIFAAGRERIAAEDTWIGIHGARWGRATPRISRASVRRSRRGMAFEPRKRGCRKFLNHWYDVTLASTNEAFDIMESNGVSPELRRLTSRCPTIPGWPARMNAIRKPDWPLKAADAVKYNLVTKLLAKSNF